MTVSIIDLHRLNAVTDNHESLASILEEVRRTSHGTASWQEVAAAQKKWRLRGLLLRAVSRPTAPVSFRWIEWAATDRNSGFALRLPGL
jgi:hypothetical protein